MRYYVLDIAHVEVSMKASEILKMNRKYSNHLAVLFAAFVFIFCPQNTSARISSQQSNPGVEGFWQGALDAGSFKLRLVMKFSRTPDGKLKGLLDSLDQGVNDIPMDTVSFQDGVLFGHLSRTTRRKRPDHQSNHSTAHRQTHGGSADEASMTEHSGGASMRQLPRSLPYSRGLP